jgi:hypothetical protein
MYYDLEKSCDLNPGLYSDKKAKYSLPFIMVEIEKSA